MPEDQQPQGVQVPLVWTGAEDAPVYFANQILGQVAGPEEIVLTFGQVVPPPLLGSEKERLEQIREITYVPVQVLARLSLTRGRLEEFRRVLTDTLANYDKIMTPKKTT